MNATISGYVQYLPPVLWSQESDPEQILGRMLCIFEKILTGLDDGLPPVGSLEQSIDELHRCFSPWDTSAAFLPWLASWVGLSMQRSDAGLGLADLELWVAKPELPRVVLNEAQQRRLIAMAVDLQRRRGLKAGLQSYLEVCSAASGRPRIAIDDGEAIWRVRFIEDGSAQLSAVAYADTIWFEPSNPSGTSPGRKRVCGVLLHPSAIAVDQGNNYIVADQGAADFDPKLQPAIWLVSSTGAIEYGIGPKPYRNTEATAPMPTPRPLFDGAPLKTPKAVVVRQGQYYVADAGLVSEPEAAIYRLSAEHGTIQTVISNSQESWATYPVDMVLDADEHLVVLDRQNYPDTYPPLGKTTAALVIVRSVISSPTFEQHKLQCVAEPTALAIDAQGRYIVADARDQSVDPEKPELAAPADLVRVDPHHDWSETSLLAGVAANPLIFPTGMIFSRENPALLFVCDAGLRTNYADQDPGYRAMADSAALYCVDLAQNPPLITKINSEHKLIYPTKMACDSRGQLIISERGQWYTDYSPRNWRAEAHEFGVVALFSRQRETQRPERNRVRRAILEILEEQKPAHTSAWLDF